MQKNFNLKMKIIF